MNSSKRWLQFVLSTNVACGRGKVINSSATLNTIKISEQRFNETRHDKSMKLSECNKHMLGIVNVCYVTAIKRSRRNGASHDTIH